MGIFYKRKDVEVNEDDPFKNDLFENRKERAESLMAYIENIPFDKMDAGFVIYLDSIMGEGKTTFIRMFRQHLKNEKNIYSIYFDAFAHDLIDNSFIGIMTEFIEFSKKLSGSEEVYEKLDIENINKFRDITIKIVKNIGCAVVKKVSWDTVDMKEMKEDCKTPSDEKIEDYNNKRKIIKDFKKELENVAKLFYDKYEFPLIIIIDELDRCNPIYAKDVIEKTKQLFSVENVVFILSMDKAQIEQSFKHFFGLINPGVYLNKFLDAPFYLPKNSKEKNETYIRNLNSGLPDISCDFIEEFNLSLRDKERLIATTSILETGRDVDLTKKTMSPLILGMGILNIVASDIHRDILNGIISSAKTFLEKLSKRGIDPNNMFFAFIIFCVSTDEEYKGFWEECKEANSNKEFEDYTYSEGPFLKHIVKFQNGLSHANLYRDRERGEIISHIYNKFYMKDRK